MSIIENSENKAPYRDAKSSKSPAAFVAAPAILRVIPANAQSAAIKIGMVSPTTGPIAAFGEADDFILKQVAKVVGAGIANNGKIYPIQVIAEGLPVEFEPRRGSRVRIDPGRKGRSDPRRRYARRHQSGRGSGRGQRSPLHNHQRAVAALFLRPQRRSEEGLRLDLSFLLGPRGRHRGLHDAVELGRRPTRASAACFPTTPTATPGAIPKLGFPKPLQGRRLQPAGPRPLSAAFARLQRPDRGVQEGQCARSSPV